ncbi:hypothetical protein ACEXOS_019275 [Herbiconiux sp. P16]|uniref:hypothetical protein n=1 Tax=Herbiconiux wuyangfengii TaxID=3342794 RepID=UPI0035BB318F
MRRLVTGAAMLAAATALLMSGCAGATPSVPDAESVGAAPVEPELWGRVALWVSPTGDVVMCQPPFVDVGFGSLEVCDDPLAISGLSSEALPTASPGAVPAEGAGWTWSNHVVTGHLDGDRFAVTGVDTEAGLAASAAAFPVPPATTSPGYATDEEKSAAMFAEADPAGYGCAAPAGGWRDAGDIEGLIGPYSAAYPEQVVGWSSLRVADDVHLALIGASADADLEAVGTGMRKLFPDAACIVTSRVSASDLERALGDPALGPDPYLGRSGSDANGRTTADPFLWVSRTAPSDELDAAVAQYPEGLVQVHTWFQRLP